MARRVQKLIFPALFIGALFLFSSAYLNRDLWFDEALTYLNFALLDSPAQIYRSYIIPNNQILYTATLHYWIKLFPGYIDSVVWLRLFSFLIALLTLIQLHHCFRVRMGGRVILLPVLIALAVSVPFLIYASALRGYMLSAFLVVIALDAALNFAGRADARRGIAYAFWSFAVIAVIPSNLLALGGVALYAMPLCGRRFYTKRAFWGLVTIPLVAFALFYLPIFSKLLKSMALGEGWRNAPLALLAVYAAFFASFAMLLLPACGVFRKRDWYRRNWLRLCRAAIWLLPIPAVLLLPVAPFPRVFFPLWPLWVLLLAGGLRDLTAYHCRLRRRRRWNFRVWIGALAIVALGWGFVMQQQTVRRMFSDRFGGAVQDDYFYGYYLRDTHKPRITIAEISRRVGTRPQVFYMSFAADPWALMYYLNTSKIRTLGIEFDGPRGPVPFLEPGTLAILRADESAEDVEKRFRRRLTLVYSNENHGVYRVR